MRAGHTPGPETAQPLPVPSQFSDSCSVQSDMSLSPGSVPAQSSPTRVSVRAQSRPTRVPVPAQFRAMPAAADAADQPHRTARSGERTGPVARRARRSVAGGGGARTDGHPDVLPRHGDQREELLAALVGQQLQLGGGQQLAQHLRRQLLVRAETAGGSREVTAPARDSVDAGRGPGTPAAATLSPIGWCHVRLIMYVRH